MISRYTPLSRNFFVFCVELLGNAIRNYDQIKGIHVLCTECKTSQYARKQRFVVIGSLRFQKKIERVVTGYQNIRWSSQKVKALGVKFTTIKGES